MLPSNNFNVVRKNTIYSMVTLIQVHYTIIFAQSYYVLQSKPYVTRLRYCKHLPIYLQALCEVSRNVENIFHEYAYPNTPKELLHVSVRFKCVLILIPLNDFYYMCLYLESISSHYYGLHNENTCNRLHSWWHSPEVNTC